MCLSRTTKKILCCLCIFNLAESNRPRDAAAWKQAFDQVFGSESDNGSTPMAGTQLMQVVTYLYQAGSELDSIDEHDKELVGFWFDKIFGFTASHVNIKDCSPGYLHRVSELYERQNIGSNPNFEQVYIIFQENIVRFCDSHFADLPLLLIDDETIEHRLVKLWDTYSKYSDSYNDDSSLARLLKNPVLELVDADRRVNGTKFEQAWASGPCHVILATLQQRGMENYSEFIDMYLIGSPSLLSHCSEPIRQCLNIVKMCKHINTLMPLVKDNINVEIEQAAELWKSVYSEIFVTSSTRSAMALQRLLHSLMFLQANVDRFESIQESHKKMVKFWHDSLVVLDRYDCHVDRVKEMTDLYNQQDTMNNPNFNLIYTSFRKTLMDFCDGCFIDMPPLLASYIDDNSLLDYMDKLIADDEHLKPADVTSISNQDLAEMLANCAIVSCEAGLRGVEVTDIWRNGTCKQIVKALGDPTMRHYSDFIELGLLDEREYLRYCAVPNYVWIRVVHMCKILDRWIPYIANNDSLAAIMRPIIRHNFVVNSLDAMMNTPIPLTRVLDNSSVRRHPSAELPEERIIHVISASPIAQTVNLARPSSTGSSLSSLTRTRTRRRNPPSLLMRYRDGFQTPDVTFGSSHAVDRRSERPHVCRQRKSRTRIHVHLYTASRLCARSGCIPSGINIMEDIHSYEQRSSNDASRGGNAKTSRVIIADRCNPNAKWTSNSTSGRGFLGRFFKRFSRCCSSHRSATDDATSSTKTASSGTSSNASDSKQSAGVSPAKNHRSNNRLGNSRLSSIDVGPFCTNEWRTSKYTILTFLPTNLYEQFRRIANFYFLITAILQMVIPFSPVGPTTSILPLLFVVSTTAIKQAYEDFLRHKRDKEVNNRTCHVLRDKKLIRVRSKDVKVGDIVYIRNNEEIPCDMILLASGGLIDRCYVTTANLDGETSLKSRSCFGVKNFIGGIEAIDQTLIMVECEQPNATLYEFKGYMRVTKNKDVYKRLIDDLLSNLPRNQSMLRGDDSRKTYIKTLYKAITKHSTLVEMHTNKQAAKMMAPIVQAEKESSVRDYHEIPLDISNLLLRASRLRNTSHIYGLAVFTGKDTKLAHNSQVKPNKFSSAEARINLYLLIAFVLLVIFALVGALLYSRPKWWFMDKIDLSDNFFELLMAHYLLYNYLIPISLYVTLEFVKFLGTMSIVDDDKMKSTVWRSTINTDENGSKSDTKMMPAAKTAKKATTTKSLPKGGHHERENSRGKKEKQVEGPRCNSSDLNEELGQIQVLFSDKTGTLTENKMRFTACSIYGDLYRSIGQQLYYQPPGLCLIPVQKVAHKLASVGANRYGSIMVNNNLASQLSARSSRSTSNETVPPQQRPFDHRYVPPMKELKLAESMTDRFEQVAQFFVALCLCSTICLNETLPLEECLPDKQQDYNFQSASPDEESLISAANMTGLTMCKSNERECYIVMKRSSVPVKNLPSSKDGKHFRILTDTKESNSKYIVRKFERLMTFEFNSVRKRMSVVCRDCDNDCIVMVTKGSESVLDCLSLSSLQPQDENIVDTTLAHFEAFAKSGLRTMLVGYKMMTKKEYDVIDAEVTAARLSIQDKEHMLAVVYKHAESNLRFLGTTAVEDTLQEGVPKTIADLKSAGIRIWLLTGDKVETACSVAYLCKLLDRDMILLYLTRQQDSRTCQELLTSLRKQIESMDIADDHGHVPTKKSSSPRKSPGVPSRGTKSASGSKVLSLTLADHRFALIADGRSLYYAMKYCKEDLKFICKHSECVLGCRLSPLQKAEIVEMIKEESGSPITAAIGDGANDVSMIQEAHVGIGINGKEGRQAVNSSDFAINRFHMLNRLLFVHGHLFYYRTSKLIQYFFYKNMILVLPQFIYSFFNKSSATTLYQPMMLICYNMIFTSAPITVFGIYETHIPEKLLERFPRLYSLNKNNHQLRLCAFFTWISLAAIQGTTAFFFLFMNWGSHTPLLESGKMTGMTGFSVIFYMVIIILGTFRLFIVSKSNGWLFNLSCFVSVAVLPVIIYLYSLLNFGGLVYDNIMRYQIAALFESPMFWLATLTTIVAAVLPDILLHVYDQMIYYRTVNSVVHQHR